MRTGYPNTFPRRAPMHFVLKDLALLAAAELQWENQSFE